MNTLKNHSPFLFTLLKQCDILRKDKDWEARLTEAFGKNLKKLFPYNIILVLTFFSLPLFTLATQDEEAVTMILLFGLVKVNPFISLACGFVFGIRHGFKWALVLCVGVWAFLCIFLFFAEASFFLLILFYMISAFLGCWFGSSLKRYRDEMYL